MKRIRLFIKGLLFLSFFLPFFVLPTCSFNSKAAKEQYVKDSLCKDSIFKDSLQKIGMLNRFLDSINKNRQVVTNVKPVDSNSYKKNDSLKSNFTNTDSTSSVPIKAKSFPEYFSCLKFLIYPTDETISGFGITVTALSVPFQDNPFEISSLFFLIFSLSFFISLCTLIIQYFKPCRKKHLYLSIISLFILIYLGVIFEFKNALWGYDLVLIFNLSDIFAIYLSLKRKAK